MGGLVPVSEGRGWGDSGLLSLREVAENLGSSLREEAWEGLATGLRDPPSAAHGEPDENLKPEPPPQIQGSASFLLPRAAARCHRPRPLANLQVGPTYQPFHSLIRDWPEPHSCCPLTPPLADPVPPPPALSLGTLLVLGFSGTQQRSLGEESRLHIIVRTPTPFSHLSPPSVGFVGTPGARREGQVPGKGGQGRFLGKGLQGGPRGQG